MAHRQSNIASTERRSSALETNVDGNATNAEADDKTLRRQIARWVNEGGAGGEFTSATPDDETSSPQGQCNSHTSIIQEETEQESRLPREAVGMFPSAEALQGAIDELLSSGFDRAELSLLASEHAVFEKVGRTPRTMSSLAEDPAVPRAAYVSPEAVGGAEGGVIGGLLYVGAVAAAGSVIAAGGALAVAIVAAAVGGGAGGLVGSILAKWIGDHHADYLQKQIELGGLLLWVRTWDAKHERRAVQILQRHGASEIHVHTLPPEVYMT
jgi:hypothetical protein